MSRKKTVSIRDVAALTGLSTATVSRYLNDPSSCSKATREKLAGAVEELGYQFRTASPSSRRRVIGILATDPLDHWPSMLTNALEPRLWQKGYLPTICHSDRDAKKEEAICRHFIDIRVSGVICVSGNTDIEPMLKAANIPVVYVDHVHDAFYTNAICVTSNHYLGAYMATEHLLDLGCRRILFLGRYTQAAVNNDREHGYLDALQTHGITPDPELIQDLSFQLSSDVVTSRDLMIYLVKSGLKFDGVFAPNDNRAYGALFALRQCGLRVPEDVRIVGFDDLPCATYSTPAITTVRQDIDLIATKSSDILIDIIEHGDHYTERSIVTPVYLVRRGTT